MTKDVTSLRALHDAYAGPLFVFALRSLGDRQTAEEIVQDTLVRAWKNAHRYDPDRGSVSTWLYTIARNLVIDDQRRRAVRPETATAPEDLELTDDGPDFDRTIEAWQVAEALTRLSAEHRDAILECYFRQRTIAEAAERLDIPEGTVKSRLFYGLRALRLQLEEMGVVS